MTDNPRPFTAMERYSQGYAAATAACEARDRAAEPDLRERMHEVAADLTERAKDAARTDEESQFSLHLAAALILDALR